MISFPAAQMSSQKKINTGFSFRNKVVLIKGGSEYFHTLEQMIRNATHFIQLQVYIFEHDSTGMKVAESLIEAAMKGVKIQLLFDGYASANLSPELIRKMRNAGIRLRFFEPLFKSKRFYFGRRLHHKILVCDGTSALVGGINISDRYNDLPGSPAWMDWALHIEGEAAYELNKVCNHLYARREEEILLPMMNDLNRIMNQEMKCPIRIRRNDWVKNLNQISASYMEMLKKAKEEIIFLSSYFIPSTFFRREMIKALQRGVKIKLILAGRSDVGIAKNAERFLYRWAFRNGIEIYEYKHNILHGKMAICDGEMITLGSYNINEISAKASVELNIDVEEKTFASNVVKVLNKIMINECEKMSPEDYGRSIFDQLFQWMSYEIYKLVFTIFTFYFKKEKRVQPLSST